MKIQKVLVFWLEKFPKRLNIFPLVLLGLNLFGNLYRCDSQTVLNVTNYGAKGDAILTSASTVLGSTLVTLSSTNNLNTNDVGKIIEIFGAGPQTAGTNHQDLIATIESVTDSNKAIISVSSGATASNLPSTFGTQNAGFFQSCIDTATGANTDIMVPPGRYLLIPPKVLSSRFRMENEADGASTVVIRKGGLRILGTDPEQTVLLGNGAWQLRNNYVHRGFMFWINGPVSRGSSLTFRNLTFDGGVQQGHQSRTGFIAQAPAAEGWDETHGAIVEAGPLPLMSEQHFINCRFVHWRGEMVKSVTGFDSGMILVTNCSFSDGNGSGFNFNWTPHRISGCLFSNLDMAMEYYVGTMQGPSVFENSTLTDLRNAIVLVGGLTRHPSPGYTIQGNTIADIRSYGILLGPACNVNIASNQLSHVYIGIATDGAAYQGTDYNHDITISSNSFQQVYYAINIGSDGRDRMANLMVASNRATGCNYFAYGYGWGTNLVLQGNVSDQGNIQGNRMKGQWYYDDSSNQFPSWRDAATATGLTNFVSYAFGRTHQLYTHWTNSLFMLDDRTPLQIPHGASLNLTNLNSFPVNIQLSARHPGASTIMLPSHSGLQFIFTHDSFSLADESATSGSKTASKSDVNP